MHKAKSYHFTGGQPVIKRYAIVSLLILFLSVSAALQYKIRFGDAAPSGLSGLRLKTPAPDFQLQDLKGKMVKLSQYRGQVVILDFWATWCVPCRSEFVELKGWINKQRKAGKREAVTVIAVNLGEDPPVVSQFVRDWELPFAVLLDRNGAVADQYNVRALPSLFLIDGSGAVRRFQEGYQPGLTSVLDKLIQQSRGRT